MMRRAEWRPGIGDPETLVGWTLRAMVEEAPRTFGATALVLVITALTLLSKGEGGVPFEIIGWTLPVRRRRASDRLGTLAPEPSQDERYPVCVRLWRQGVRTGQDDGIAAFFDGWLVFEGRRTAFAVRSNDVLVMRSNEHRVRFNDGSEAELVPYDRLDERRRLREAFDGAFRRWRQSKAPKDAPLLPPHGVHPWARGQAVGAIVTGTLLVATSAGASVWGSPIVWAIAGTVALCGVWRAGRGAIDSVRLARLD